MPPPFVPFEKKNGTDMCTERTDNAGSSENAFLMIPAQNVEFENGDSCEINSFFVHSQPVTIRQFEEFTQATGYKTTAERGFQSDTFRNNFLLHGRTNEDIASSFVMYVSLDDAVDYCIWCKERLLSEADGWRWRSATVAFTTSPDDLTRRSVEFPG